MEIFTLDANQKRRYMFDDFESLLWTERYNDIGDFQINLLNTDWNRRIWKHGFRAQIKESSYQMNIETIEKYTDSEGRNMLAVRGRSLESILYDRIARANNNDLETSPKWTLTNTPHVIAMELFNHICLDGALDPQDILPGFASSHPNMTNRVPFPTGQITVELEPQYLYDAIQAICKTYDLGVRMISTSWDSDNDYRYQIYTGFNRTTGQMVNAPVVFAPDLENLRSTTTLSTVQNAKNVAYIISNQGWRRLWAPGVSTGISGFRRNVLLVNVTDVPDGLTQTQINAYLDQKGREELAKNRAATIFDGEATQQTQYRYGRDYALGDLVEMRDEDNNQKTMIVTEQIFVSDQEGERSYPTLSELTYIKDQLIDP